MLSKDGLSSYLPKFEYDDPETEENPCKALLLAILDRAIRDAIDVNHVLDRKMARAWFNNKSKGVEKQPFSFQWVCSWLDLIPKAVRDRIAVYEATNEYPAGGREKRIRPRRYDKSLTPRTKRTRRARPLVSP